MPTRNTGTTLRSFDTDGVLRALACDAPRCVCQQSVERGGGLTHCPAHDDEHPSLSVTDRGGRTLWRCHAGCDQYTVTRAVLAKLERHP